MVAKAEPEGFRRCEKRTWLLWSAGEGAVRGAGAGGCVVVVPVVGVFSSMVSLLVVVVDVFVGFWKVAESSSSRRGVPALISVDTDWFSEMR